MYIYYFTCELFTGTQRTIITSFPVGQKIKLEQLANVDNTYPPEKGWKLKEIVYTN